MNTTQTKQEKFRKQFTLSSWTGAGFLSIILLGINYIFSFVPMRLDLSEGRLYSISDGTKGVLKKLDDTVIVRVIFSSDLPPNFKLNEQFTLDLLSEYRRASGGKIRIERFDPTKYDQGRERAISDGVAPLQLEVRAKGRQEIKECFMGVGLLYGDKKESVPIIQNTDGLEYELTQRLRRLISPTKKAIGIVSNGEGLDFSSEDLEFLAPALTQLYEIRVINLKDPIPVDIKSLWVIGPKKEWEPEAFNSLKQFVVNGGTAGLLIDRFDINIKNFTATPIKTGFETFFEQWGFRLGEGIVVDPQCDSIQIRAIQGGSQMLYTLQYPYFPWATDLNRQYPATKNIDGLSMPFTSPIEILDRKQGLNYIPLIRGSRLSYVDTNPSRLSPLDQRAVPPTGGPGYAVMGALIEGTFAPLVVGQEGKVGRMIVIGTSKLVNSSYPARQSNINLFLNLIDWSVQDEELLAIRSKGVIRKPLREMTDLSRNLVRYSMMTVLPILTVFIGLLMWRRQKNKVAFLPLVYKDL
ncbi:MAG: GldG family protein [Elusimicrobiota bacterium]